MGINCGRRAAWGFPPSPQDVAGLQYPRYDWCARFAFFWVSNTIDEISIREVTDPRPRCGFAPSRLFPRAKASCRSGAPIGPRLSPPRNDGSVGGLVAASAGAGRLVRRGQLRAPIKSTQLGATSAFIWLVLIPNGRTVRKKKQPKSAPGGIDAFEIGGRFLFPPPH